MLLNMLWLVISAVVCQLMDDYLQTTHASTHSMYTMQLLDVFHCQKDPPKFKDYGNRWVRSPHTACTRCNCSMCFTARRTRPNSKITATGEWDLHTQHVHDATARCVPLPEGPAQIQRLRQQVSDSPHTACTRCNCSMCFTARRTRPNSKITATGEWDLHTQHVHDATARCVSLPEGPAQIQRLRQQVSDSPHTACTRCNCSMCSTARRTRPNSKITATGEWFSTHSMYTMQLLDVFHCQKDPPKFKDYGNRWVILHTQHVHDATAQCVPLPEGPAQIQRLRQQVSEISTHSMYTMQLLDVFHCQKDPPKFKDYGNRWVNSPHTACTRCNCSMCSTARRTRPNSKITATGEWDLHTQHVHDATAQCVPLPEGPAQIQRLRQQVSDSPHTACTRCNCSMCFTARRTRPNSKITATGEWDLHTQHVHDATARCVSLPEGPAQIQRLRQQVSELSTHSMYTMQLLDVFHCQKDPPKFKDYGNRWVSSQTRSGLEVSSCVANAL